MNDQQANVKQRDNRDGLFGNSEKDIQDRIQQLTNENERIKNQLQIVSRESKSIQAYEATTYNQSINLTNIFKKDPKIQDFFQFKCERSTFNKIISLLSYTKGSSYVLSHILKKNITNQKKDGNDIFIYNYQRNKQQNYQFINTKKMGQPIGCQKQIQNNKNLEYKYLYETEMLTQTMINNFLIDLVSNISDIQILIVNEVTQQEQNLIMQLKSDFLLCKKIKDNKQLIVIHLLSQYDEQQIEEYSEKIQDFFKLVQIENEEYYLMDQEFQNISHFIIGNEHLQEKERYFDLPIDKIKQIIFNQYIYGYSIHDRIQEFINQHYKFYVQISDLENDIKRQQLQQQEQSQIDLDKQQMIINENQNSKIEHQQIKQFFIQKENDLVLDQELYEFQEVKNYYYKLQASTVSQIDHKINFSNNDEQQLMVNVYTTGKFSEIGVELIDSENKLLIRAQQQMPNTNQIKHVEYQLQNHIFKFYELNDQANQKYFENKDGSLVINLKRTAKYSKEKLSKLCKDLEPQYKLSQISYAN
ncbi:hypothetical protein ABPG74_010119 [Tetrahymena malaccensis]